MFGDLIGSSFWLLVVFPELLDNLRPVSPKPGHVERVKTPSCNQSSSIETEEEPTSVFRERFLKINVRHITDGEGVVSGVLLVTPNAVMFDPNVSDPLVSLFFFSLHNVVLNEQLKFDT